MPEEKKRFPWWLVVCALVCVIGAALLGFIETVGRRGTIVGRYERLLAPTYMQSLAGGRDIEGLDMNMSENDVVAALGSSTDCRDEATRWWRPDRNDATRRNCFGVLPKEPQLKTTEQYFDVPMFVVPLRVMRWEEGPVEITVAFTRVYGHSLINCKCLRL